MKDKQAEPDSGQPRIPFISAALHCVAMTAIVYLRSSFGFVYLRPKSVFFAFTWAWLLFTVYAWREPGAWRQYGTICLFGAGSALLYWCHLLIAFVQELYRRGEHDHYSGTSHAIRFVRLLGNPPETHLELNVHIWVEPAIVLAASAFLRFSCEERHISSWLVFAAGCIWVKEAFNHWFHLRQRKRKGDMIDDTGETINPQGEDDVETVPNSSRTPKQKHSRNPFEAEEAQKQRRFAEILRLLPPFTLDRAEANYRELVKAIHPDANESSEENDAQATDLGEAIQYFRAHFRSRS